MGCLEEPDLTSRRPKRPIPPGVAPTDDDEYVPDDQTLTAINTGDSPPTVPNRAWEARAKQLEDEQARVYGEVFTADPAANGIMAGKERSHLPQLTLSLENDLKRVSVLVQHVMGKNGLPDAGLDAALDALDGAAAPDAARDAAAEAGEAGAATGDGGSDAGRSAEHYITSIYLRADIDGKETVVGLWEFSATDPAPAIVKFTLPAGVRSVVAYEWCTLHGLWKSDPLST